MVNGVYFVTIKQELVLWPLTKRAPNLKNEICPKSLCIFLISIVQVHIIV